MKFILILFLLTSYIFAQNLKEKNEIFEQMYNNQKLKFANMAIPIIIKKNKEILNDRNFLLTEIVDEFPDTFMSKKFEIEKNKEQKRKLLSKYLIEDNKNKTLLNEEIKNKVAPLNLNLILAHLLYESNFGQKEIASKGYNFFNISTNSKKFENFYNNNDRIFTIKYKDIESSIHHYFDLINIYPFGEKYRILRNQNFNAFDLLTSLSTFYPENTNYHLNNIQNILINTFHMKKSEKNDFNKAKEYSNYVYDKYIKNNLFIKK